MPSAEELRTESRRLREAAAGISDLQLKQELAERALELAQRAEAVARSEDPEIIRANIKRYQAMIAVGIADETQRHIVEEMLADAERLLGNSKKQAP